MAALVRFCSACGAALPGAPPVTCDACGTSHWLNPKPCANGIVLDRDRVLLARRSYSPWKDLWGSPGGFVEAGEHPVETVEREVLEETGVRVEVTGYLGVWIDRYADDPEDEEAAMIDVGYYLARPEATVAEPDSAEVSEIAWFAWDALPAELAPPGTLAAVLAIARAATPAPILDRRQRS